MPLVPELTIYQKIKNGVIKVHHKSPAEFRFWAKVNKNGPIHPEYGQCWNWIGSVNEDGYGNIWNGKVWKVHRYSYVLHGGVLLDNEQVLHKCDRPSCVNPMHLFVGSQQENIKDMVEKNRQAGPVGENNSHAKLTETQVLEIRRIYKKGCRKFGSYGLAKIYNVSSNLIQMIIRRQCWRHI